MRETLDRARAADERRGGPLACDLFRAAREDGALSVDDLYALSDAAWWIGENAEVIPAGAAAYHAHLKHRRPRPAANGTLEEPAWNLGTRRTGATQPRAAVQVAVNATNAREGVMPATV